MRLGACLGVGIDIIEPCGFLLTDRGLKRAGMDYLELADMRRFSSWARFLADRALPAREGGPINKGRLLLLTTRTAQPYTGFTFAPDDTSCWDGKAPECRKPSMMPRTPAWSSPCGRAPEP